MATQLQIRMEGMRKLRMLMEHEVIHTYDQFTLDLMEERIDKMIAQWKKWYPDSDGHSNVK